jgi:cytochrome c oxidase subunit 3
MSVMGLFFILIFSVALSWLWRQGVMQSPWLEEGEVAALRGRASAPPPSAAKVGLVVFLAVAGCLFSLMTAAYFMRQASPDWQAPPMPGVLWLNTIALMASSVTIQTAARAASSGARDRLRTQLAASGLLSLAFLVGQLWAWRELVEAGAYVSGNPASSFFYLLTATHGLHLVGGLAALARVAAKAWEDERPAPALAGSVELCAIYWHFLLFVWLLLFIVFSGKADAFGVICRRVLS